MLSVIIPAYKEKYLNRTIRSLLWNKAGEIEIIVVLDGADQEVLDNHRVHVIKLPERRGLRNAINLGVKMARGEYILKTDAHCKFGKHYDLHLKPEHGEVMIPRRFDLDCANWKEYGTPSDFHKLVIHPKYKKFHGQVVRRSGPAIMETLSFQGSCWVMKKSWFETIGELDEITFGTFDYEPVEISFKTWQNGGKLLVNKNIWYAHPAAAKRTHNTPYNHELWSKIVDLYQDDYKKYVLNHALY
jgi:glycosyltransferase involved in cell wall biosynthesis